MRCILQYLLKQAEMEKNLQAMQVTFEDLKRLRRRIERLMQRNPELIIKIAQLLNLN